MFRAAQRADLPALVRMLADDPLGQEREVVGASLDPRYLQAFERIQQDPQQHLMVAVVDGKLVGTCHASLMPSLTYRGSTRLQLEAVRVSSDVRSQGVGRAMLSAAMAWGRTHGAVLCQLTTDITRPGARRFYEAMGFCASHVGMKRWLDDA